MSPRNEPLLAEIATQSLVTIRYFSSLKRRLERLSRLAGEITNEVELDEHTQVWVTKNLDEVENFLKEARKTLVLLITTPALPGPDENLSKGV